MKLVLCKECQDVIRLTQEERSCQCGKCKGYYLDDLNAVYGGEPAIPLGFSNPSLVNALHNQPESGMGETFQAFVIPKECETFVKKVIV